MKYFFLQNVRFTVLISCSLIIYGCVNSTNNDYFSFKQKKRITEYKIVYTDSLNPLGDIDRISLWDKYIFLHHSSANKVFSLIDTVDYNILRAWGEEGHGINESLDYGTQSHIEDSILYFYDVISKSLCSINLDKARNSAIPVDITKVNIPYTRDFRPSYVTKMDSHYVCLGSFANERFGCLDSSRNIVHHDIDYPFDTKSLTFLEKGMTFQGQIIPNKCRRKCLIMTYASDVFEIIDMGCSDSIYRSYISPYIHAPEFVKVLDRYTIDTERSIVGFLYTAVTNNHIFFLYSNELYNENERTNFQANRILCFDWEGAPVMEYILPFDIQSFAISTNYIYAIVVDNGINKIVKFNQ